MVMTIIFSNVGNRDVRWRGETLLPARPKGKEVLEAYETYQAGLSADILEPIIEECFSIEYELPVQLYLFVTDQEGLPNVPEQFLEQDTVYFGEILKRYFTDKYGTKVTVSVRHYDRNPTNWNEVFDYFSKFFLSRTDSFRPHRKIVSTAGGIPTMNYLLFFAAFTCFKDIKGLYTDASSSQAVSLPIREVFLKEYTKQTAKHLINRHNYSGTLDVLEANDCLTPHLKRLLNAGKARLAFDFQTAFTEAEDFKEKFEDNTLIKHLHPFINSLASIKDELICNPPSKEFFLELYWQIKCKWDNGEYTDFLARVFRFEEACYHYLICLIYPTLSQKYSILNEKHHWRYIEKIQEDKQLDNFLRNQKFQGSPLKIEQRLHRSIQYYLIKYPDHLKKLKETYHLKITQFLDFFDQLNDFKQEKKEPLRILRNKSILTHGCRAVSKEIIEGYYVGLLEDVEGISRLITRAKKTKSLNNPFHTLNEVLLKLVNHL